VFDTKANIATLTGDVRLTQGTTITTGPCARLDMNTGSMRLLDACGFAARGGTGAAGREAPVSQPKAGRAQVLLYPGLVKEQQQKDKDRAKAAPTAAAPAPSAQPTSQRPPPAARRAPREEAAPGPFGN
jgi:lipopolysaccharide export system protein LptA